MGMVNDRTAKPVSLVQLHQWLKENSHLTWHLGSEVYGQGAFGSKHTDKGPHIKYVYPNLDTRSMEIFSLRAEGFLHYVVDFREEFDGTILDLLVHKIKNGLTISKEKDA
jgi:hypothetical protein